MGRQRLDLLLILLLALAMVRGIVYASMVPPWQAPDEPKHFEYVALLQQKGRLVAHEDASLSLQREIISSMKAYDFWRFGHANSPEEASNSFADIWKDSPTQLDRPPLYYLAASPFYHLAANGTTEDQLYAVRLFSVLLGVLTVFMTFLAVRTVFPRDAFMPIAAAAFVAFLPMHTFITSTANSDNLANLITATLAYAIAKIFKEGATLKRAAGVLVLLLAGFWTKRTTLFVLPLMALAVPIYIGRRPRRSFWLPVAGGGLALAAAATALALSERLQGGLQWIVDRYLFNVSMASNLAPFLKHEYTLGGLLGLYSGFSRRVLDSFWAQFGWMNVRLDAQWYDMLAVVALLSLAGLLYYGARLIARRERLEPWQARTMVLYLLWVLLVVGVAFAQSTVYFSPSAFPQGRYLFPALVPIAIYFILGLKSLVPQRLQPALMSTIVAGIFLFDSLSLVAYILPFYYQPG